ncbi:protein myomaker isoform X1 [Cervus canadensis]|uniref:protein myomaker isoform X1 n=1 Tax=Cervus canadensis TaxID=1574408 RepID=UPI001C9E96A4|nr:protein myomaker isoform X1 [Cervus canadensis]
MGTLMAKLLLPTVSSLAFLPTVSIAAKRRFHMEAMVYLFTTFFLVLHHACTGPGLSVLCFLRHDVLEYFSVYGTALSMWVSLMALADFDEPKRSTLVMFGVLTIAVRIYHDRWGYGVYSGPIGSAILIIAAKWLPQMKETRRLFPDKSVYTQQIGPGLCFGALALMLRFFFELLPLRPGHVLHPAAAQGQQEGWKRGAPRQAGLLHPLLCLHLTGRPGSEPRSAPSPACRGRLSCLTRRNVPPRSLRPLQGFGKHRPGAS